jgi:myo-inositol-1(or 4)-monophosphatase
VEPANPVPLDATQLDALRTTAETVATEAAALVRRRRRDGVEVADRKSSVVDVVTAVDREAEEYLLGRLAELRPGDGFFGEEGGRSEAGRSEVTWVVDPIDGTVNFLYGIPQYCVSVAAVGPQEQSLAGAVVDVATGDVYSAARGGGATCNGVPLRVRDVAPMGERLFLTGFQYQQHVRRLQGTAVARLVGRVRDIRRMGSAALDLCAIAAGRADAYVEEGLNLWDRAAASLVATEAGATVGVLSGAGGMECVVCAPADGYADVLRVVRECGFLAAGVEGAPPPGDSGPGQA